MSPRPASRRVEPLRSAFAACVPALRRHCADPWVVIGSAAAWLVGADVDVADLDVLTSARDARSLAGHWRGRALTADKPEGADRFRSYFARFLFPLPVEVMGDLEVVTPSGWKAVHVDARRMVEVAGLAVPVPTVDEQIRLLECFGRPKDRRRVGSLKRLEGTFA